MALTATSIRNARAGDKPLKLFDGGGLYLLVNPNRRRLEPDIFPWLGGRPIAEIAAPELLASLRRIESRGAIETAHRAQQNCSQVFRYAVATGRAERDPTADLRGALTPL